MQSRRSEKQAAEKKERKKGRRLVERQTVLQFALQPRDFLYHDFLGNRKAVCEVLLDQDLTCVHNVPVH